MKHTSGFRRVLCLATCLLAAAHSGARAQEVIVFGGPDEARAWLEAENWWGEENRERQLRVPRAIITGISPRWEQTAQRLPVAEKKEIFYRFMLPLIVHANEMVSERRKEFLRMQRRLQDGKRLSQADLARLRVGAQLLRLADEETAAALTADSAALPGLIDEILYRLDVIPAGLALGQAAYESGYGTSRFAREGNALFGQWTFDGTGLLPEQQRARLGDHRIAAFRWPFDSVRAYFINLMSHPAYADFRRRRAELRAANKPLTSLELADGLARYSERGLDYVRTLKSIIRVNGLQIADGAAFRDEPLRFLLAQPDAESAVAKRAEIERLRTTGELEQIITRMQLE